MPLQPIQLPIRSNETRHGYEGHAGLVNAYVEELGQDAKAPFAAYSTPGLSTQLTLANGSGFKDMIVVGDRLYVISGEFVYSIDTAWNPTYLGGIPTGDAPATMVQNRRDNGPQIGIISDGLYNVIETSTQSLDFVQDTNLRPASSIAVLDGHFIFPTAGDDRWQYSAVDDAKSFDPLDFASAESSPDVISRAIEFNREIWFFGGSGRNASTEIFQNTTSGFVRTSAFARGCLALGSVAEVDEKLIWVADDETVRITAGEYRGTQISNHGVERAIEAEPNKSAITATTWSLEGHHFYNLNGSTFSYQFDTKTGSWSQRKSYGLNRWRVNKVVEFNGKLVAGDYNSGKIFIMSKDTHGEDTDPMIWEVIFPPVHAWPHGLIFDAMHVDIMTGVGLNTTVAHNLDPKIMLDWSDDGGRSFSTQRTKAIGRDGDTNRQVRFNRLGALKHQNQRTFRLSGSADVDIGIFGASIEAEALAA